MKDKSTQTAGFDGLAEGYDRQFTGSATGRLQREVVYRFMENKTAPGAAVLELNCGTGEDALWLARRGCRVLATDLSAPMVAQAAAKARAAGLEQQIQTAVFDMRLLGRNLPAGNPAPPYDLIWSNFGGLNCLNPDELHRLGAALPALLRPGGYFAAVVMGRFCAWESLYFLLKGRPQAAMRRLNGGPVRARLNAETHIDTWYYAPAELRRVCPELSVRSVQPVGCWVPPSYLDPWFARRPRLLAPLAFVENKSRGRLWAWAADHFLILFQKD